MEKYSMQEQSLLICANVLMTIGIIAGIALYFLIGQIQGIIICIITIIASITVKCFLVVIVEISKNIRNKISY